MGRAWDERRKIMAKVKSNIALSDWFDPPVIHRIERRAGGIRVEAGDDVRVAKVRVKILNENGNALEQEEAVQVDLRRAQGGGKMFTIC
jgi:hypothetical protein